jgi:hypothetical protein
MIVQSRCLAARVIQVLMCLNCLSKLGIKGRGPYPGGVYNGKAEKPAVARVVCVCTTF